MKMIKLIILLAITSISVTIYAQNKIGSDSAENPVRARLLPSTAFKLPYSIEINSSGDTDERSRVIVRGWDVKGKISSTSAVGGAAAASYAATGRIANEKIKITISQPETGDNASTFADEDGNFSLRLKHDTLHTIFINGQEYGKVKLKGKHDTVKNSVGNVR